MYSYIFNIILIDGIVVAEHNDYDDSDSDYSESEYLICDDDAYTGEDILFYIQKNCIILFWSV